MGPAGPLLHAKHAFMPNKLGFCGPDDRGMILEHLQESTVDERFISILKNFEAAYPFIQLIGKSNQRDPFDQKVTEAYWIGNELLDKVGAQEFYNFTISKLGKKNKAEIRKLFLDFGNRALPHHTFYVISTATSVISDFHHTSGPDPRKVSDIMDNCRISWGRVEKVEKDRMWVKYRPFILSEGKISLGPERTNKDVEYNPSVQPFDRITPGQYVSMHWNFACDVLSAPQAKNIANYTKLDLNSANIFLHALRKAV
jgi:hypothetical protein